MKESNLKSETQIIPKPIFVIRVPEHLRDQFDSMSVELEKYFNNNGWILLWFGSDEVSEYTFESYSPFTDLKINLDDEITKKILERTI